ncbi:MAG: 1-deoxy-D-xylulose-5-phosphate reductoisomerase [Candidatus Nanopelagicales bacterium]
MVAPIRVIVLGSTGSIGTQALAVIDRHSEVFEVVGLAAGANIELLAQQAKHFAVPVVALADSRRAPALTAAVGSGIELLTGPDAAADLAARPADVVLNAITGAVGLAPTLAALRAGTRLALANKESLIIGGPLVKDAAAPGQIVPVDSEHSALAQGLLGGTHAEVSRLVLTASGGPFRGWSAEQLASVTPAQALAHPTWSMGPVVTINSATLVNKGLEVIEAHLLFDIPYDRIAVTVHPQSIVHSLVEFVDGSTLAQVSPTDMRIPIALGLAWPRRLPDVAPACDWSQAATWTFEPLDETAFPAIRLARQAGISGATAPAVFNAANEVCVEAFQTGRLPFPGILGTVEAVLAEHERSGAHQGPEMTIEDVLGADAWARAEAASLIDRHGA